MRVRIPPVPPRIYNNIMTSWHITTDLLTAAPTYIGEVLIEPKESVNNIRHMLNKPKVQSIMIYYYGELDPYVMRKFGYIKDKRI